MGSIVVRRGVFLSALLESLEHIKKGMELHVPVLRTMGEDDFSFDFLSAW